MKNTRKKIHPMRLLPNRREYAHVPRGLLESLPLALHQYRLHSNGDLIFEGGNPAADRLLKREHRDLIGLTIEAAFPDLASTATPAAFRQIAAKGGVYECKLVLHPDGRGEGILIAQAFQTGPGSAAVILRDIRENTETEQALAESEKSYQRLFEEAALAIFQSSPEGKALAVNPAFARMFGYTSPEEVLATIQNVATDIFADPNRRAEIARMAAENPKLNTFENVYRRKDGSTFPGTLHLHPVRDPAGRLLFFEGLIEDITERKQAEVQLRYQAQLLAAMKDAVIATDERLMITSWNQAAEAIFGWTASEVISRPLPEVLPTVFRDTTWEELVQAMGDGQDFRSEVRQQSKSGSWIPIESVARALRDDAGRVNGYMGVNRDITDRKLAEHDLAESEERYRKLIEAAPLGLHQYELLPDGRLIFTGANPAADRILGLDHQQMIGLAIEEAFPSHRQTEIPAIFRQVAQEGTPYSCEQIAYRDEQIEGVFEIHAFQTGPSRMAVFFQDITEKKKAEEALRESEEKFRMLIEKNSEGVILYDEEGRVIEWNAAQESSSGIPREEALGRFAWDLQFQVLLPEQKSPSRYAEMEARGLRILQTGVSAIFYHPIEVTILGPDGKQVIIQQISFPIKTRAGFRIGSIMRDVTDRKQAELDLRRRMVELEALHAVAQAGTEAISTDELLDQVAEIIRQKLYPDHFEVGMLDPGGQMLNYHPTFIRGNRLAAGRVSVDWGISGVVAQTGLPRRVDDIRLDPEYKEWNPDTRSELCVPIKIGSRVTGVINLENKQPGSFTEADERLVTAIAGELGTALEKIRLLESEQNRRKELEALEQISTVLRTQEDKDEVLQAVLEQVMSVMNLQGAGFAFRNGQSGELVTSSGRGKWPFAKGISIPADDGVSWQVARTQHYFLNNGALHDPRLQFSQQQYSLDCFLCVALIVDNQTQGLLYFARNTPFLPADVHLAIAIADTVAGALHRIELHEQTGRQLERLTALRAIDQSILSRLDLDEILETLLEKITGLLHVEAADILLYDDQLKLLKAAARRGLSSPAWEEPLRPGQSHAGRVAQEREIEIIPDLGQIKDDLTEKIQRIGGDFAGYAAVPLLAKGELKGVLQVFTRARLQPSPDWIGFLEALADQSAIAINGAQLFTEQQQTHARLTRAYEDTIDGWSRALDLRDKETEGHSQRVTDLTLELARRMDIPDEQLVHIRRGAKLHDIGKMGIPDSILLKPDRLSAVEWEIMRQHPVFAADLLFSIEFLSLALDIPFGHHEKWDGSGYPQGLKNTEIPLAARIFAVIDVWDALTHDRPYRPAWTKQAALDYIREQSGKHFDPSVVEKFLAFIGEWTDSSER